MFIINWAGPTSPPGGRRRAPARSKSPTALKRKSAANQTNEERQRDGEKERRRDGETKRRSVPPSLRPSVPLSLRLSISLSLRLSVVLYSEDRRAACGDSLHRCHGAIRHYLQACRLARKEVSRRVYERRVGRLRL